MLNEKELHTDAINSHGNKVSLKVRVIPMGHGETKEFATVENAANYFMETGASKAKKLTTVVSNLESVIRGYEVREVDPCNRMTAYSCYIERSFNV